MKKSNHLLHEKSPYLIQHAFNPVDWYPWGPEAFEKARREDKPILVSIGYSTCHWCHVMEHESYEDPAVAALMNDLLINIKVDREERPDVDKIYMTAVSAMTGSGGWPLNIFLTPDLKPFFGGTYFPPQAKWGHPAWRDVVNQIGSSWKHAEDRQKMVEAASHITEALQKYTVGSSSSLDLDPAWLEAGFQSLRTTYDGSRGGFGGAPKFPMPVYHNFLLRYWAKSKNKEALDMSLHTLREMAKGGIYDHLGGGFARYSTDENWHVPHFEKMLYDNAQLAVNYLEAYQITGEEEFKRVVVETLDYIQRDMTHPEGGFYSAEDADSCPSAEASEKTEGAFYVWDRSELLKCAGEKDGELFAFAYGVREGGNAAQDPHGEFRGKNILYRAHPLAETARHFHRSEGETQTALDHVKARLREARSHRPRPHLDDKIISAWNGLMISAFSKAYQVLGDPTYLISAQRAAHFLQKNLYDEHSLELPRRWRAGDCQVKGIADDYAFVGQGLIDLYESDFEPEWLKWATQLTETLNARFCDASGGGYFMTAMNQDAHLLLRVKEDLDNVEPSASSVATLNLLRLAQMRDRTDFQEAAEKTLKAFGLTLKDAPRAMPQMLVALDFVLSEPLQVVMAGQPKAPDAQSLLEHIYHPFLPVKTVVFAEPTSPRKPLLGKATAYVCVRQTCKQPTSDPQVLDQLLRLEK